MRTRAALRRAPLLLEQPTDLVHACLMFLDLEEMRAAKSVCHAFCKAARFWLNDVRWLGKHISLHRIHEVARGYLSESEVLQVARRNSGLTTAQFDECFLSHESFFHDDEMQHILSRLMAAARSELFSAVRPWLSRAALARVRACPDEASQRSVADPDDSMDVQLLPLHQALRLGLGEECVAALAAAHPPSPSWRLADLLRARQFGDAAAIARLASPGADEEVQDAVDQRQAQVAAGEWAVTPSQLSPREPTFLHLAAMGAPSAALLRRLLELLPTAAAVDTPQMEVGLPLHLACSMESIDSCYPPMSLEAFTLLARANPEAVGEVEGQGGVTPLLAAALLFPERVPMLLEANPDAAAVAAGRQGEPSDDGYRFRGMLPLHAACASGNEAVIRALLEAYPQGASIASTIGMLPHQCAARSGRVGALRLLLAAYPEGLHQEDDDGLLPIDETDVRTVEVATAAWCLLGGRGTWRTAVCVAVTR